MAYENAPALGLVATNCCVCGRALIDAESLKSGIGPVCAEKTLAGREALDPGVRAEVNRLVYELAAFGRDVRAVERLGRLRELGFGELVARIEERLEALVKIRVRLFANTKRVYVELPAIEERAAFEAVLADLRAIPGRRWEVIPDVGKRNTLPKTNAAGDAFKAFLARHFPGRVVSGLKGLYVVVPSDESTAA